MNLIYQQQDSLITQSSGVGTIWLLATLGSKSSYKKVVKKDIMSVSIPDACKVISSSQRPMPLRISSNLLYGVALIYKQKIEYFHSDASLTRAKLQRENYFKRNYNNNFMIININNLEEHLENTSFDKIITTKNQHFLADDSSFNVEFDLLPSLFGIFEKASPNLSDSEIQRKQLIKQTDIEINNISLLQSPSRTNIADDSIFDTSNRDNSITSISKIDLDDDNILHTVRELPEDENIANLDFEFGEDGLLVSINKPFDLEGEKSPLNNKRKIEEIDQSNDDISPTEGEPQQDFNNGFDFENDINFNELNNEEFSVTNPVDAEDKTYQLSITERNTFYEAEENKRSKKQKRGKNLILDEKVFLTTTDLREFRDKYLSSLEKSNDNEIKDKKATKQQYESITLIDLIHKQSQLNTPFVNLSTKCIFQKKASSIPLHSLPGNFMLRNKEYSILINKEEDIEIGRHHFMDHNGKPKTTRESSVSDFEVGRNVANMERRNSRSSFSSLNLPNLKLMDDENQLKGQEKFPDYGDEFANDNFDLSFGPDGFHDQDQFNALVGPNRRRSGRGRSGRRGSLHSHSSSRSRSRSRSSREHTRGYSDLKISVEEQLFEETLKPSIAKFQPSGSIRGDLDSKTKKFYNYLQSRVVVLGEEVSIDVDELEGNTVILNKISFEKLVPSTMNDIEGESPIKRSLAAASFASILQLTTRDFIGLNIRTDKKFDSIRDICTSRQIEVIVPLS